MNECDYASLSQRYLEVKSHIVQIAIVELICVSKGHPVEAILHLFTTHNQMAFGENYVQELAHKIETIQNMGLVDALKDIQWHFIGRLQSKNIPRLARLINEGYVQWIHSLDDLTVAHHLHRRLQVSVNALIQINVHQEEHDNLQGGIEPQKFADFYHNIVQDLPKFRLLGVMALGRDNFDMVRELSHQFNLPIRSIGMSDDYEEAILIGHSTHVRLGQCIFGPRNYDK